MFRELISHLEWKILLVVIILAVSGIATIYSSSYMPELAGIKLFPSADNYWEKQLIWFGFGLALAFCLALLDYHVVVKLAYIIYGLVVLMVIMVFIFGAVRSGSRRWLEIGGFSLQPSEAVKLALAIVLTRYFSDIKKNEALSFRDILMPGILTGIPFLFILLQPDLGTAISVLAIFFAYLLLVGLKKRVFVSGLFALAASAVVMWFFLQDYQKKRILMLLGSESDARGSGYNIIQSKIAVGSGGIWGKGYLHGSQGQLRFLPESHTDFIFSVFAEEWGFVGVAAVILLFSSLIFLFLKTSCESRDKSAALLSFGVAAMLTFQIIVNVSMIIGLMPIVGIPLPFFSYGGSSMITTMGAVGLILSIRAHRYMR